jgi:hypothetical protein
MSGDRDDLIGGVELEPVVGVDLVQPAGLPAELLGEAGRVMR